MREEGTRSLVESIVETKLAAADLLASPSTRVTAFKLLARIGSGFLSH